LFPSDCRICSDPLLHISQLPSQISLTSHERYVNLREAFSVARPSEVTGREVVLVDDRYTIGTTATECARVLRRAGAAQVWIATLARTTKLASKGWGRWSWGQVVRRMMMRLTIRPIG
jgi:predicted amidophosphoribosyltransferase